LLESREVGRDKDSVRRRERRGDIGSEIER
jgi:hypothetical protein